jgi:hypothetical protein
MTKRLLRIGDLVKLKQNSYHSGEKFKDNTSTGIIVDTTQDDMPNETDYWINVVFLDGSKATLFHDEVTVLGKNESR